MSDLKSFLREQLKRAYLKPEFVEEILQNTKDWEACFTHKSINPRANYETFEFYGDKTLNALTSDYVKKTYTDINNVVWLTKIFHYITSNKILAQIGFQLGIDKFIKISDEFVAETMTKVNIKTKKEWLSSKNWSSVVEDTMEAFFGCLKLNIERLGYAKGVGFEVCSRILYSYYRETDIDISYDNIFDPITRLKELYQSATVKWYSHSHSDGSKVKNRYLIVEQKTKGEDVYWEASVYAWPSFIGKEVQCDGKCYHNDKKNKDWFYKRATLISSVRDRTEADAKRRAALEALKILKERYELSLPQKPKSV